MGVRERFFSNSSIREDPMTYAIVNKPELAVVSMSDHRTDSERFLDFAKEAGIDENDPRQLPAGTSTPRHCRAPSGRRPAKRAKGIPVSGRVTKSLQLRGCKSDLHAGKLGPPERVRRRKADEN